VTASRTATTPRPTTHKKTYIVKPGDTLTAIALKTGVSLERIQSLNPSLDAQTLNTGDKVKLAP
jgi:LysM repeat protein